MAKSKIKPMRAWALIYDGAILADTVSRDRLDVLAIRDNAWPKAPVIRVEIRPVPVKKVKK